MLENVNAIRKLRSRLGNIAYRYLLNDRGATLVWGFYDRIVRMVSGPETGPLKEQGYYLGCLPMDMAERWLEACKRGTKMSYSVGAERGGYVATTSTETVELMKDYFRWLDPESLDQSLIASTIEALRPHVARSLGANWRVVNFKVVHSIAGAPDFGMYDWHLDHFPENFHKLLIYISGATTESGCTELRMPDGKIVPIHGSPGSWALFNANLLWHRGRPVLQGERLVVELTITRSFASEHAVGYGGVNSCYPYYPWTVNLLTCSRHTTADAGK